MAKFLLFILLFFNTLGYSQFGPIQVIDESETSSGIKKIITADMNNDGLEDIVMAQGFNVGHIGVYRNNGDGSFSDKIIADALTATPNSVAVADFNLDGWKDIVTLSQTMNEIVWLPSQKRQFF